MGFLIDCALTIQLGNVGFGIYLTGLTHYYLAYLHRLMIDLLVIINSAMISSAQLLIYYSLPVIGSFSALSFSTSPSL